jgi:hypothetical protein
MRGGIRFVALDLRLRLRKAIRRRGALNTAPGTGPVRRKDTKKIFWDLAGDTFSLRASAWHLEPRAKI